MSIVSLNSLYSYSKLYSNFYSNSKNNKSSNDMNSIITKYAYFRDNYKDIKSSLKSGIKGEDSFNSTSSVEDKTPTYYETKITAGELGDSLKNLSVSSNIFKSDEDGKYDMDKIVGAVEKFISSYNELKEIGAESKSNAVVQQEYYIVNTTLAYKGSLSRIGINVKSDNTLELDAEKLKSANVVNIKALFNGTASYGAQVQNRVDNIKKSPQSGYIDFSEYSNTSSFINSYLKGMNSNNSSVFDLLS